MMMMIMIMMVTIVLTISVHILFNISLGITFCSGKHTKCILLAWRACLSQLYRGPPHVLAHWGSIRAAILHVLPPPN